MAISERGAKAGKIGSVAWREEQAEFRFGRSDGRFGDWTAVERRAKRSIESGQHAIHFPTPLTNKFSRNRQPGWLTVVGWNALLFRTIATQGLQQRIPTGSHPLRAAAERRHQQTCYAAKAACAV
jgi:hypothetical protein